MARRRLAHYPFNNYYVYKPSFNIRENRYMIKLIHIADKSQYNTSYARYLYQVYHGVIVDDKLKVDHIDGDKTHDKIDNFQLLTASENNKKAIKELGLDTSALYTLKCPFCEAIFQRKRHSMTLHNRGYFCSKTCSGKFYTTLDQTVQVQRLADNIIKIERKSKILIELSHNIENWEDFSEPLTPKTKAVGKRCATCSAPILTPDGDKYCSPTCASLQRRKIHNRPTLEDLRKDLSIMSYCAVGRKYGVSDNAVRKWLKAA
jgi:HNH endonuclease